MRIRIVVADQSEALFYETDRFDVPLQLVGRLAEVPKSLVHEPESAVRRHVPPRPSELATD